MIKTVITAVDGSETSDKALALAADLAARYKARLVLVHALLRNADLDDLYKAAKRLGILSKVKTDLDTISEATVAATRYGEGALPPVVPDETLEKLGALILEKSAAKAGKAETRLRKEDPAQAVLACAEAEKADLIVIGSRGYGRLKGLLLGSVSQKVVEESSRACLIVK